MFCWGAFPPPMFVCLFELAKWQLRAFCHQLSIVGHIQACVGMYVCQQLRIARHIQECVWTCIRHQLSIVGCIQECVVMCVCRQASIAGHVRECAWMCIRLQLPFAPHMQECAATCVDLAFICNSGSRRLNRTVVSAGLSFGKDCRLSRIVAWAELSFGQDCHLYHGSSVAGGAPRGLSLEGPLCEDLLPRDLVPRKW